MRALPLRAYLLSAGGFAAAVAMAQPVPARAQDQVYRFDIPAQDLGNALNAFARIARRQVVFEPTTVTGKRSTPLIGQFSARDGIGRIIANSGLEVRVGRSGLFIIQPPAAVSQAAPGAADEPVPGDIVVTAQKRAERIQDVPIAISAFTQETLDKQKIEGGPDLLKAIPNLTFSKNNFAGFNLSIRGIGTKAVSVTTDPGVAINFNSTTLITNRFFEQEFFDIERIEVLRGPQGTLYGRNATGGVVNIISNKGDLTKFDGYIRAEVGNYGSRRAQGAINVPIVADRLAVRLAGAYTDRSGFTRNDLTGNRIDSRDLYTTRATVSAAPVPDVRIDAVWERFRENDSRARTAKQLCHRDDGVRRVGALTLSDTEAGALSQGCRPGSLYEDAAYGVPNGLSLPYVILAQDSNLGLLGYQPTDDPFVRPPVPLLTFGVDPYGQTVQTRDLRRISAISDPKYRATANVYQLNASWDLSDRLTLTSQTTYNRDRYYSTQDYNRFNTVPVFNDSTGLKINGFAFDGLPDPDSPNITPGGVFDDPQLGPSSRLVAQDLITASTEQFTQEVRLSTSGGGPLQATAGGNYTWYRNETDYFVFINALSAIAQSQASLVGNIGNSPTTCGKNNFDGVQVPIGEPGSEGCIYIDPNPLASINGEGHNYFRSSNRYSLYSYGLFADGTYALTPELKLIAGLRYNDDIKRTTPVPSQLLLSTSIVLSGTVDRGYPALPDIRQHFKAVTGRAGVQWTPDVAFTDDTMVYGTYSRGYKGGGTNPPPIGFSKVNPIDPTAPPFTQPLSYPDRFSPEYVNAFEVGMKNTLLGGRMTLNVTGYLYDFKNFQVSQIIDRSAVNENVDATMYGVEFEGEYRPVENLAINGNIGLQHTRIGKGERSLDVLDRTQGNSDFVLVKAFPILPSNCVVRRDVVERVIRDSRLISSNGDAAGFLLSVCPGFLLSDTTIPSDAFPNEGRGFYDDVSGNELPNAPKFTANLGIEYTIPFADDWFVIPRGDVYHQSQSFSRIYNSRADRLRGWENVNLSVRVGNPTRGLLFEAYVKNVFDASPITDTFVNSDDTGLTTNVFTIDPRVFGINVSKKF